MKNSQSFFLFSDDIYFNCVNYLSDLPRDGKYEVIIREVSANKTLKQLGALFGLWIKEESDRMGESEVYVHAKWKAQFLARIYFIEQKTPEQEMWVEYFLMLKNLVHGTEFETHSKRISLSWATLDQTVEYMKAIEEHYQAEGSPLTVPDKHYKIWCSQ